MKELNSTPNRWGSFFEKAKDAEPRKYLVDAIQYVETKKNALDLGAGTLRDTRYLLDQGFEKVIAMDGEYMVKDIEKELGDKRLETIVSSFEDFEYEKEKYDLINAQYSLPFMQKEYFNEVIEKIKDALKINGVFVGTFFGDKDSWNNENSKTQNFHTKEGIEKMFEDFQILELLENEEDKPAVNEEMKHWHTLHITPKKVPFCR